MRDTLDFCFNSVQFRNEQHIVGSCRVDKILLPNVHLLFMHALLKFKDTMNVGQNYELTANIIEIGVKNKLNLSNITGLRINRIIIHLLIRLLNWIQT